MIVAESITVTEEITMLCSLIEQDHFEPACTVTHPDGTTDVRIIYLMNDAAESFLLFRSCVVTGPYPQEDMGPLDASLSFENNEYRLIIRQKDIITTLFFSSLQKEIHLYNYAALGHFWLKDHEYLRNIEYHLAILRDKRDYLGVSYCTEAELNLAYLTEFPPLNYCCYPSASPEYEIPMYPAWRFSKEAISVMQSFSKEADDSLFSFMLSLYRILPFRRVAERLAVMLRSVKHQKLTDLILERISEASAVYPDRNFSDAAYAAMLDRAKARKSALLKQGIRADIVREEPFTVAGDSISFNVYLMVWHTGSRIRTVSIEQIQL